MDACILSDGAQYGNPVAVSQALASVVNLSPQIVAEVRSCVRHLSVGSCNAAGR